MKYVVDGQRLYPYSKGSILADDSVEFAMIEFVFSPDWAGMSKVAQFTQNGVTYSVVLENDRCLLPNEIQSGNMYLSVFGYIGDKRGTSNQLKQHICESGFGSGEAPIPPTPDLYAQLLEQIEISTKRAEEAADRAEKAAENAGEGGTGGGTTYTIGHGLKLDKEAGNLLSVDSVSDFGGDNTLPMTASGVETVVGNIDVLLQTL